MKFSLSVLVVDDKFGFGEVDKVSIVGFCRPTLLVDETLVCLPVDGVDAVLWVLNIERPL